MCISFVSVAFLLFYYLKTFIYFGADIYSTE